MKVTVGSRKWHQRHKRQMLKRRGKPWCLVYGLVDPREPTVVRYVGQSRNTRTRLDFHLENAAAGRTAPVNRWIRDLVAAGVAPKLVVLDQDGKWDITEVILIERLRAAGTPLLNVLLGGTDSGASLYQSPVKAHPDAVVLS